jgi:hypothetical protein
MNRKLIAAAAATCLTVGLGATAAAAAPPSSDRVPAGIQCQQAGISTLQSFDVLDDAAREGVYVVQLEKTLPLSEVLRAHRDAPQLFQTGGVSVTVPGLNVTIPATWCDGIELG